MKSGIKAIVFDIGGVLCKNDFLFRSKMLNKLAENHEACPDKFRELRKKYHKKSVIGMISAKEFENNVMKELNVKNKARFSKKWNSIIKKGMMIDKEVHNLIKLLKKDYLIGTLTDVNEMFDKSREKRGVYKHFKFSLKSYEQGLRKPDKKFYEILIKELKLLPKEILFIDDEYKNVIQAKKLGINAVLYKNKTKLVKDLKRMINFPKQN